MHDYILLSMSSILDFSSPIYLGPKNLDTFWCTGWAWNWQIIFRFASIHGRACFILYRTEKTKNMNFQLIYSLNAYLFLCWIWKAFKAQVCPHFSNITHQTHGRHGHFELSVCMVRQLDYYVTICWWRAFLWQNFHGDLLNSFDIAVVFRCRIAWYCYV